MRIDLDCSTRTPKKHSELWGCCARRARSTAATVVNVASMIDLRLDGFGGFGFGIGGKYVESTYTRSL
jgi:hypothetical protein